MSCVVKFQQPDGIIVEVSCKLGQTLMHEAVHHGVEGIFGECGGCCACATCHIYVDEARIANLPAPDVSEEEMLDAVAAGRMPGSRLSCQVKVTSEMDGMLVVIPKDQF